MINNGKIIAIPPGETIKQLMKTYNVTKYDLAERTMIYEGDIDDLLNGGLYIYDTIAKELEYVFGIKAEFWLNLEKQYREDLYIIKDTMGEHEDIPIELLDYLHFVGCRNRLIKMLENNQEIPNCFLGHYHAFRRGFKCGTASIYGMEVECRLLTKEEGGGWIMYTKDTPKIQTMAKTIYGAISSMKEAINDNLYGDK